MINFADIKNIISDYKKKVDQAIICIGVDDKKQQIAIINEQIQDETIWSDNTKMSKLMTANLKKELMTGTSKGTHEWQLKGTHSK